VVSIAAVCALGIGYRRGLFDTPGAGSAASDADADQAKLATIEIPRPAGIGRQADDRPGPMNLGDRRNRAGVWLGVSTCVVAVVLLVFAAVASANTIVVTSPGDGPSNCPNAPCTLRGAVAIANNGDTVSVPASAASYTVAANSPIPVSTSISIVGSGASSTVLDGGNATCLFEIGANNSSPTVSISSITLRNANGTGCAGGGAIHVDPPGSVLTVSGTTFTRDASPGAGGAINSEGVLTVRNSTFSANTASGGAGGAIETTVAITIDGSTFSNNTAHSGAGGAVATSVAFTVTGSSFSHNSSSGGGGAIASFGTGDVTGSSLSGNTGSNGGAIDTFGALTLRGTTLTGNTAGAFGGAIQAGGQATIQTSTFSDNASAVGMGGGGGAIFALAPITVSASTLDHNTTGVSGGGGRGGAINATETLALTNSTLTANTANSSATTQGRGGALSLSADATLTNVTLADNSAVASGGNINSPFSTVTLQNTIVAGGVAPIGSDCSGTFSSAGHNLEDSTPSQCGLTTAGDRVGVNPLLGPLQANGGPTQTQALSGASQAIGAGDNAACPLTDQRGVVRPHGSACDIGAYELAPPAAATGAASGVSINGATLQGQAANADVVDGTTYFQYGTTTGYGSQTPAQRLAAGSGQTPLPASLVQLTPGSVYHFRLVGTNPDGTSFGADQTFVTLSLPVVSTGTATAVSHTGATVSGTVNPEGSSTSDCHFQYGPTTAYGSVAPCGQQVGGGSVAVPGSARISALAPGTVYHYRLLATTAAGTSAGADASFRTAPLPRHFKPDPTMTWMITVRPLYTVIASLSSGNAPVGAKIVVRCAGRGCLFRSRTVRVTPVRSCTGKGKLHRCRLIRSPRTIDLTPVFAHARLAPGSRVTVSFVKPGYVGKVYLFTIRSGPQPTVLITCLAPGSSAPGKGC
jgi:predicted outer membrane repeat protein